MHSLQQTHFRYEDTKRLKVKDGKRYSIQIVTERKLRGLYYCQTKYTLSQRKVTRDKEGHYILRKDTIQQDTILINICS